MDIREISMAVSTGGTSQRISISGTSAQSSVLSSQTVSAPNSAGGLDVLCTVDVDCFVRQGSNPTALADGTDQLLLAGNTYRLSGIINGNRLAFITSGGTGNAYLTPGV